VKEAEVSGAEHISNPPRGIFMVRLGRAGRAGRARLA
jgi:hypothetical protein